MNKKIKILIVYNFISYLIMATFIYIYKNNFDNYLDIGVKFLLGIIPYILVMLTSFILVSELNKELVKAKKEVVIDWCVRVVGFIVAIEGKRFSQDYEAIILIIILGFLINCLLEYKINKKAIVVINKKDTQLKKCISVEEQQNIKSMVKVINSLMINYLIFAAGALSISYSKNIEGGNKAIGYLTIIVSIYIYIWYMRQIRVNYYCFYLNKEEAKITTRKDTLIYTVAYIISLIGSLVELNYNAYMWIMLISIIVTLPAIETFRKMSFKLKEIKENLDEETFNYFLKK